MPNDEEQKVVYEGVYDYLRWISEQEATFRDGYMLKIHRIMTIQILLFAGMSFALSQAGPMIKVANLYTWFFVAIGIISSIMLFRGFYYCIRCLRIKNLSVLGVKNLDALIKDDKVKKVRITDLFGDLSQNIANAILENRNRDEKGEEWGNRINNSTQVGAILAACFVMYGIAGGILVKDINKEQTMTDKKDDSNDSPSFVEPTDTIQADDIHPTIQSDSSSESTRPSAIEGTQLIQHSLKPPNEKT